MRRVWLTCTAREQPGSDPNMRSLDGFFESCHGEEAVRKWSSATSSFFGERCAYYLLSSHFVFFQAQNATSIATYVSFAGEQQIAAHCC